MSGFATVMGLAWIGGQIGSMLMLELGSRFANHRHLLRLGRVSHGRKMRALDRVWPLTKLRPALQRGDTATCATILSSLIALKSAASFVFGLIMLFWLPLASFLVPSIITVHDPDKADLMRSVKGIAALQVTSHALAASAGFAVAFRGPLNGNPLLGTLHTNATTVAIVLLASIVFAVVAGRAEASILGELGLNA